MRYCSDATSNKLSKENSLIFALYSLSVDVLFYVTDKGQLIYRNSAFEKEKTQRDPKDDVQVANLELPFAGNILSMVYSEEQNTLAVSASGSNSIQLFRNVVRNNKTGSRPLEKLVIQSESQVLQGPLGISHLCFFSSGPTNYQIFLNRSGNRIEEWDLAKNQRANLLYCPSCQCICLSKSQKYLAATYAEESLGQRTHKLLIISTETFSILQEIEGHSDQVNDIIFCENDQILMSAGEDKKILITSLVTWKPLYSIESQEPVKRLLFLSTEFAIICLQEAGSRILQLRQKQDETSKEQQLGKKIFRWLDLHRAQQLTLLIQNVIDHIFDGVQAKIIRRYFRHLSKEAEANLAQSAHNLLTLSTEQSQTVDIRSCSDSKAPVMVAVKGPQCSHLRCFDQRQFLDACSQKCPICRADTNNQLIRDKLFQSIVNLLRLTPITRVQFDFVTNSFHLHPSDHSNYFLNYKFFKAFIIRQSKARKYIFLNQSFHEIPQINASNPVIKISRTKIDECNGGESSSHPRALLIKYPCKFVNCNRHQEQYFDLKDFYYYQFSKGQLLCPICKREVSQEDLASLYFDSDLFDLFTYIDNRQKKNQIKVESFYFHQIQKTIKITDSASYLNYYVLDYKFQDNQDIQFHNPYQEHEKLIENEFSGKDNSNYLGDNILELSNVSIHRP